MKKRLLSTLLVLLSVCGTIYGSKPSSWTAQDALGRKMTTEDQYGVTRPNKSVGMFYVIWHGSHGYDRIGALPEHRVRIPSPADSLAPYDIQKILDANPTNPQYGPVSAFHHWGEPYLGYYVSNDKWVLRKHAQMLSDAGVDVIILDVTNAAIYLQTVIDLCDVYTQMRSEGSATPQIAFLFNTKAKNTVQKLYDALYAKGLYKDLWFQWKGKPLILTPPEGEIPEVKENFTIRHSWFCSAWPWFEDGKDKWPWADRYPQIAGWHESPDQPEVVAISPATHAHEGIGRSYHNGHEPEVHRSGEGLCYIEQAEQALEIDPEFLMITGWNEWSAMRFTNGRSKKMCGKPIKDGDTFFVDAYNHEFSRDLEPLRGDFGDNYYYQTVDIIRRFKGVEPHAVYSKIEKPTLDGKKWDKVAATYVDDKGDTAHRNHHAYGYRLGQLINNTGENDIVESKVAFDGKNLKFYVRCAEEIVFNANNRSMQLFIDVLGLEAGDWEGFQYFVNKASHDPNKMQLMRCRNGWNWSTVGDVEYSTHGREMVVSLPLSLLGITNTKEFTLDFKWIDNAVAEGDIQECLSDGDTAPNGRFRYRYTFKR